MAHGDERVTWRTASGDPVTAGDLSVTPISRGLTVRWPNGGWVWNRPTALLVERDAEAERIPIVDVTRMAQLGLYALSLLFAIIGLVAWIQERRTTHE